MALEDPTNDLKSLILNESWHMLVPKRTKIWMFIKAINSLESGICLNDKKDVAAKALSILFEQDNNDTYSMLFSLFLENSDQLLGFDPTVTPEEVAQFILTMPLATEFRIQLIKDIRSRADQNNQKVVKLVKIYRYHARFKNDVIPTRYLQGLYDVLEFYKRYNINAQGDDSYLDQYGVQSEVVKMFLPSVARPGVTETYIRLQKIRAERLFSSNSLLGPQNDTELLRTRDIMNTRYLPESLAAMYLYRGLFPFERHLEAIIRLGHIDTFKTELIETCLAPKPSYDKLDALIDTYTRSQDCMELYA